MTNTFQGAVDGLAEPVDDHVDIFSRRDIRWRQQHVIATAAVDRAARRITGKAALEPRRLDLAVALESGIERLSLGAIGHELDRPEQAAPADVADMPVIAKTVGQPPLEMTAKFLHPVEQPFFSDHPLHFKRRRTGERVREIGVPVLESARSLPDRTDDAPAREHCADRLIAAAQPLGDSLDIRGDAFLLPGVARTGAAHA